MYRIYSIKEDTVAGIFINLKNLEVNYYNEVLPLDKYLKKYDVNNNIIINVIPISNISTDISNITKENTEYINMIYKIINSFNNPNIKFCSTSIRIYNLLIEKFFHNNCGYYISDDLNYPNCSFYIFPQEKFDIKKIYHEIKKDKKVFIFIDNEKHMEIKNKIISNINNYDNIYLIEKTL